MDLIVGMGMTGLAVAQFLKKSGMAFATYDDKKSKTAVCDGLGFDVLHFQKPDQLRWHAISKVIVSPGFEMSHPILAAAIAGKIPIVSEIELAFRHTLGRVVAVTGTNGKSTTSTMIHHVLVNAGFEASLCGNIGSPFIAVVTENECHIHVVEVSSFQLEHVRDFRPEIGILLNVVPDHLDRHGSFEVYSATKLRLFQAQSTSDTALIGESVQGTIPGNGRQYHVPGPWALDREQGLQIGERVRISARKLPPSGSHLRSNMLFAAAVCARLGLSGDCIAEGLQTFEGLEHRFETVGTLGGVVWINDSKATNVHAAQAALRTIDRPFVLILGGYDKKEKFDSLDFTHRQARAIVAYGATAPQILRDLQAHQPHHVDDFDAAVRLAQQLAKPGDAVLLAPACSSFDQHENFAARGRRFKMLFHEMESVS